MARAFITGLASVVERLLAAASKVSNRPEAVIETQLSLCDWQISPIGLMLFISSAELEALNSAA